MYPEPEVPAPEPPAHHEVEVAAAVGAEAPSGAEPPDKGAFLRLFSGLRES